MWYPAPKTSLTAETEPARAAYRLTTSVGEAVPINLLEDEMSTASPFEGPVAQGYDRWYDMPWGAWSDDCQRRLLVCMAQPRAGERVLDVGCGTGRYLDWLMGLGLEVQGLDASPDMLALARKRLGGRLGPVRLTQGDAARLPFQDASVDLVCAVTTLEFVPDPQAALREMARVARGRVFVGVLGRWSLLYIHERATRSGGPLDRAHFFTPPELVSLARAVMPDWWLRVRTALAGAPFRSRLGGLAARWAEVLHPAFSPLGGYIGLVAYRPSAVP